MGSLSGCLVVCLCLSFGTANRYPVILLPGNGGSRIHIEVSKDYQALQKCSKSIDKPKLHWVNLKYLNLRYIDCLTRRLTLHYKKADKTTHDTPGVKLTNPGWGHTEEVEYIGNSIFRSNMKYYATLVKKLVEHGYERGKSVRGAPYDFRKGLHEKQSFNHRLTALIEETYKINSNKKVVLIAHSYGCLLTLQFLQRAKQSWKDKYIRSFVSLQGPYHGSVTALKMLVSGYNLGIFFINSKKLRGMQRSFPSSYALLPDTRQWGPRDVLLKSPKKSYTTHDYKQLFKDLGIEHGPDHYNNSRGWVDPQKPANVETFCVISHNVETLAWLDCSEEDRWPRKVSSCVLMYGDGDGTVSRRSLNACSKWRSSQSKPVHVLDLPDGEHLEVLNDNRLIDYILKEALDLRPLKCACSP